MPFDGELTETPTVGRLADRDVATCSPNEPAAAVQRRLEREEKSFSVVVNESGIVLGILRREPEENSEAAVGDVMESGPTTLRPHIAAADAAEDARRRKLDPILVTSSDGRLLGALRSKNFR